jgi:hypothetical protein
LPTEVWRPGDFRVCPKCKSRHKVQDIKCERCGTVLVGAPVEHAEPVAVRTSGARSSTTLRVLLVAGVLIAAGAGLWVRSLFRGAAVQDAVQASNPAEAATPAPEPTWTPPVLSYPPVVGYNSGVRDGAVPVGAAAAAATAPESTGMTSIAPPSEPTRKTAFTNEDLERARGAVTAPPVMAPTTGAAPAAAPPQPTSRVSDLSDDAAREWLSRVRDDEEKLRDAQAKVRRIQTEIDVLRTAASSSDPDAQARAQHDLDDRLDDLEKADRKVAEKQRDLDDTKDKAHAAGLKLN